MKITELKEYKVVGGSSTKQETVKDKKPTSVGQKILNAGSAVTKFLGGEAVADTFGSEIAKIGKSSKEKSIISASQPGVKETVGSAIQLGANLLPGAGKGVGLIGKAAVGAGTGYAFDVGSNLQNGKEPIQALKPGIGTVAGGALPVAGAAIGAAVRPAVRIAGRILKGLGSGVSGVSTKNIESILQNPRTAEAVSKKLESTGGSKMLEESARQIVNGVSTIKSQARKAFGEGLEQLAETDIEPSVFRQKAQSVLDKYGISRQGENRVLSNVEFDDPKNIQKASDLIDRLSNTDLDGKSLRKLADDIENSAYKVATGDERLSFNAFIRDLSDTLRQSIAQSTPKLGEMNQKFSQDMQLADAAESIFGKVNFKNLKEVLKASQKLEGLFAQKGIAPDVVDDFLTRIGISPDEFKTGEAVRQISDKVSGSNTKGLSVGELLQQITSSIVTPQAVKEMTIKTGLARERLTPFLKALKEMPPTTQKLILNALMQEKQSE